MGFLTISMTRFWKVMPVACRLGELSQVLILAPLVVPVNLQSVTKTLFTFFSSLYLPRLPTLLHKTNAWDHLTNIYFGSSILLKICDSLIKYLIPCPGPHWIPEIVTSVLPCPTETQSSPVPILELSTLTLQEVLMCIPSVLGLSSGAVMVRLCAVKPVLPTTCMWNAGGLREVNPEITVFVTLLNLIDCIKQRNKHIHYFNTFQG